MKKLFGTDGVRGVVGELITPQFANKLGKSVAVYLNKKPGKKTVLVCHDTRNSAESLQNCLVEGLTAFGIDVVLGGIMPTPAVHYIAKTHNFSMAIMITASHNPGEYNGFKLITSDGLKFDDQKEDEIAQIFYENNFENLSLNEGSVVFDQNLIFDWAKNLIQSVNTDLKGLKIALDCANGASYFIAPYVFKELGAEVVAICNFNDGTNINKDCGSTHLEKIVETVKENGCDFGFAFDGDADRVNAVFGDGTIFGGEELMYCCFRFLQENDMMKTNEIVTPIVTNGGIDKILKERGFNVVRCPVGGKHIQKVMFERGVSFGAENNGHIVWGDFNKCSCGMLTALFLCKFAKTHNLKNVCNELTLLEQLNDTIPADDELKQKVESPALVAKFAELEKLFVADTNPSDIPQGSKLFLNVSRFVVRPSGTEPIIRLVVEGDDKDELAEVMDILKNLLLKL